MTPAESDFLLRLAALSLSFVGFSAIVVTLRGALGGELSDRHLRLVRLYIEGGLLVTALGLVPTLLNLLHVPDSVTWRVASAAAALIFTFVLVIQFRRRRAVEGQFPPWVVIIFAISIVARPRSLAQCRGDCLSAECRPIRRHPNVGPLCLWIHFYPHYQNLPASRTSAPEWRLSPQAWRVAANSGHQVEPPNRSESRRLHRVISEIRILSVLLTVHYSGSDRIGFAQNSCSQHRGLKLQRCVKFARRVREIFTSDPVAPQSVHVRDLRLESGTRGPRTQGRS